LESQNINKKTDRIRFVIGSLDVGGAEKHLSLVLPMLLTAGFEPVVITLTHKGELADQLETAGIKVYQPPAWVRYIQRIPVFRMLFGPCITLAYLIFTYNSTPARFSCLYLPAAYHLGWVAAFLLGEGNRTIMFRRSLNLYQKNRPFIDQLEQFLHKRQLAIVGNSRAVIQELVEKEGVPEAKLTLIYNGINVSHFGIKTGRNALRKNLGISEDETVLCLVANLIPYKGHSDLIDALIGIRDKIQGPWRLLCVGSGIDNREDLTIKVESGGIAGHVEWLGRRNDVPDILATADIGLLVSHQEGFSNAILEGMASGLPMIVTDVGGNSEAIEHGKSGLVVKPHDPDGLGAAILQLMNDKDQAKEYGRAARERVQAYFSLETCVENYKHFLRKVMDEIK